jgi:hypothetical protein
MTTSAPKHRPTTSSTTASPSWDGSSSSAQRIRHFGDILDTQLSAVQTKHIGDSRIPSRQLCICRIFGDSRARSRQLCIRSILAIPGPLVDSCAVDCAYTAYWIPGQIPSQLCVFVIFGDSRTRSRQVRNRSILAIPGPLVVNSAYTACW